MEWKSVSFEPIPIPSFWKKTHLYQKQNELPTATILLMSVMGGASDSINYSDFEKTQWGYTYLSKSLYLNRILTVRYHKSKALRFLSLFFFLIIKAPHEALQWMTDFPKTSSGTTDNSPRIEMLEWTSGKNLRAAFGKYRLGILPYFMTLSRSLSPVSLQWKW